MDGLHRNSLSILRLIWQGWGMTAPAADVAYLFTGIALLALGATPLSILIGFLIYLTILNTSYRFSKKYISAGSDFTYVGKSIGGFMATFEGWNLLFGTAFAYAGFGMLGLTAFFGLFYPAMLSTYLWLPVVIAINLITFFLLYKGIRFSTSYQIITGIAEFLVLITGGIGLVVLAGKNNTLAVFSPFLAAGGIPGFLHSLILSIVTYIGLSIALTAVSEESKIPKKNIPKSLIISSVLIGATFVFLSYAMTVAWGPLNMLSYGKSNDPGLILFYRVSPVLFGLLFILTINSFMGNNIAMGTSMTRLFYAFSRDNVIFPESFSKINKKTGTPYISTIFILILSVILGVTFGIFFGPEDGGFVLLFADAFFSFLIRSITSSSLIISAFKNKKMGLTALFGNLIIPVISITVLVVVLASNFFPLPIYPYNYASILGVTIIIAALFVTIYTYYKNPEIIRNAGKTTAED